jgi:pimeloyl-ACP methyl ester carboxylesterase
MRNLPGRHLMRVDFGAHKIIGDVLSLEDTPRVLILQSWFRSDAWRILADYRGRLLIVAGENDPIIPRDVIKRIYDSAVNASERQLYIAPNASHFVFTDLRANDPQEFDHVFDRICNMLKRD